MINVNLLNDIQRRKFIISIKKYAKNNGNIMKSCLLIIYSQEDTDLQKILQKIKKIINNSIKKIMIQTLVYIQQYQ
jgi:type III secretory pathway lipoprotein EscJ